MIEKIERMVMLFDFYGKLLTEKQLEMLSLYYEQDFSLSEIAENYNVSRQAIHDILKRSEKILEEYEQKLGLVKKFTLEQDRLKRAIELIENSDVDNCLKEKIFNLLNEISDVQNND